jgi:polyisoprenoid-binding protein YceI
VILSRRSPLTIALLAIVSVGVLLAAGGLAYLFLRGPAPAPVGQASPGASNPATSAAPLPSGSTATLGPGGLDGTWTIDPTIGSFADFSSSFVGYRVNETFTDQKANEAVGRTPDVTGSLTLAGSTITAVDVTADMTTLQSDDDRRDGQLGRQSIETDRFPTATFQLTSPIDLGSVPAEGATISATATGELTLHGVTKTVEVPVQATLSGDVVTVTGQIDIRFADYDIDRPVSFIVLSIEDHGIMELQLHFRKG